MLSYWVGNWSYDFLYVCGNLVYLCFYLMNLLLFYVIKVFRDDLNCDLLRLYWFDFCVWVCDLVWLLVLNC